MFEHVERAAPFSSDNLYESNGNFGRASRPRPEANGDHEKVIGYECKQHPW